MSDLSTYRIGDSVAIEPLINRWVPWSDLISPAPYSLHLRNYQRKTLSAYIGNPEIHLKACRNPKFSGGPFVDIPVHRAGEVEQLLRCMENEQSGNIEFANSLTEFYGYLGKEAKGQSLEPYYEKVPEILRGYVELVYDYYNHPIVRVIESLLYESPYYRKDLQSFRIFQQTNDNCRPPFLSTPRLYEKDQIDWSEPFESAAADELFKLESEAQPLGSIRKLLGLSVADDERLLPLLCREEAQPAKEAPPPGLRIRYYGHACVLVEWNGVSILTDPWIGTRSLKSEVDRLSYDDLPEKIDYVLITHGHHDHYVPETLLRLRRKIGCLVVPHNFGLFYTDPSLKLMSKRLGFKTVREVDTLESIDFPDGEIIAIPFLGEHADLPHGKTGYVIRAGNEAVLFAADSNCLEKQIYEHVRRLVGSINTVFLGMECVGAPHSWLYGALVPAKLEYSQDKSRRTKACDARSALDLLETLRSQRVYIYAMGGEPWLQYSMGLGNSEDSQQVQEASKLIALCREKGMVDARRLFGKFELCLT
jgi:L-ascorbate metabolism protein UlaG (beta-lactamase superfamily)